MELQLSSAVWMSACVHHQLLVPLNPHDQKHAHAHSHDCCCSSRKSKTAPLRCLSWLIRAWTCCSVSCTRTSCTRQSCCCAQLAGPTAAQLYTHCVYDKVSMPPLLCVRGLSCQDGCKLGCRHASALGSSSSSSSSQQASWPGACLPPCQPAPAHVSSVSRQSKTQQPLRRPAGTVSGSPAVCA